MPCWTSCANGSDGCWCSKTRSSPATSPRFSPQVVSTCSSPREIPHGERSASVCGSTCCPRRKPLACCSVTHRDTDRASADQLATELGHLPLALEQAAAYIERTGMPLAIYLEVFRRRRQALLAKGHAVAHHGRVDTTSRLSMDRVAQTSPAGAELLRLCAFLAPEAIPWTSSRLGPSGCPRRSPLLSRRRDGGP
jgi:hypothetical protein